MTSKEALKRVCDNSRNNTNWETGIKRKDAVKKLEKDLELLDLIKKLIQSNEIKINEDILIDYPEIEEWLNND